MKHTHKCETITAIEIHLYTHTYSTYARNLTHPLYTHEITTDDYSNATSKSELDRRFVARPETNK